MAVDAAFWALVEPPVALLAIEGELDLRTSAAVTARLVELESSPAEVLYLDVGCVTFVDCSCLREIDRSRRRIVASGRRLEIVAASPTFLAVAQLAQYPELATAARGEPPDAVLRWLTSRSSRGRG